MQIAFSTLFKDVLIFFPIPPYLNNLNYCDFPPVFQGHSYSTYEGQFCLKQGSSIPCNFSKNPEKRPKSLL